VTAALLRAFFAFASAFSSILLAGPDSTVARSVRDNWS
jgi:hypothetical protein